ncbi:MAG: hypothetical protein ACREDV_06895, partial [Methylocella sp.]
MATAAAANAACTTRTLVAGQTTNVGTVEVCPGSPGTVTYTITNFPAICLTEVHLDIETSLGAIPHTKDGSPIPGKFRYSAFPSCVGQYTFNVNVSETNYVAAHAVVKSGTAKATA